MGKLTDAGATLVGRDFILLLKCPDRPGIVQNVSRTIFEAGGNIIDSAQFGDPQTGFFCMRIHFAAPEVHESSLRDGLADVGRSYDMDWTLHDGDRLARVLIMVSNYDHCLRDLLYRREIGELKIEIPAVVSNHRSTYQLVARHDIPFHHLPVTRENKAEQEAALLEIIDRDNIDFVVLARYMQILTENLCSALQGRIINIHHSFLPGFKGARPYHQAHERGVKLIGATAHYVTADLDEGPIIEQDVVRVSHSQSADELVAVGRDIETRVLSRAVRWQAEHRVILNGPKTIVFN